MMANRKHNKRRNKPYYKYGLTATGIFLNRNGKPLVDKYGSYVTHLSQLNEY